MTSQQKPGLDPEEAYELIAEVNASDRKAARLAIAGGVRAAQDKWIEAPLIAEALAAELISVAETTEHSNRIAAYLRALAAALEKRTDFH